MRKGWQRKQIGDLCEVIAGQSPEGKYYNSEGKGMPFYQGKKDFGEKFIEDPTTWTTQTTKIAREGDILMSVRAPVGPVNFATDEVCIGRGLAAIRSRAELNRDFLFYQLLYLQPEIAGKEGAVFASIGKSEIEVFPIAFAPLPEQQRIVGILDEAFDGIAIAKANAEKNLQNARAVFECVLNVAIQGKSLPQHPGDDSVTDLIRHLKELRSIAIDQDRTKSGKTDPIEKYAEWPFELPSGWKWTRLESLTVCISDGVHKKPEYAAEGIPFITVKNLTAGAGICFDDLNHITRADHEDFIRRTHPEKGDILITKDGTIGVVRLVETDIEFSIFVSVALIKPVMRELGPYLVYALRASCVQSQIVRKGAALKHLYLVDLRRLAIPLPPLSEQRRIVASLDAVNTETQRLESIYQQKLAALEELKKSLLHQAFTGQL
jgi:type I restriction enzyme S subunit